MAEKDRIPSDLPGHQQVILGGLARYKYVSLSLTGDISNIISTTLLIPLDIFQMRLRYPDTWCVKMFRIMVNCKGCPWPYEILSARMLQRRTYESLKWGIYFCRYAAHKKACALKGVDPLYQATFLLTGRAIVLQAIAMGTNAEVRGFAQERRKVRETKLISDCLHAVNERAGDLFGSFVYAGLSQDWPLEALKAV